MAIKSLTSIANKSFVGAKASNYLDKIITHPQLNSYSLNFSAKAMDLLMDGIVLDKSTTFQSVAPNAKYMASVDKLTCLGTHISLSEKKSSYVTNDAIDGELFKDQFQTENADIIIEGSYISKIPLIKTVNIANEFGTFDINVHNLNSLLSLVFNNILYDIKTPIKKSHTEALSIKSRKKLNNVLLGVYDGVINESEETESRFSISKRSSGPKPYHIRSAQKRTYTRPDEVRVLAIPPTLVHLDEWTFDELKDHNFTPDGYPTIEAIYRYRGSLDDMALQSIIDANDVKSMAEVYSSDAQETSWRDE